MTGCSARAGGPRVPSVPRDRDLGRTSARPAADLVACAPTYARHRAASRAHLARPAPRRRRRRGRRRCCCSSAWARSSGGERDAGVMDVVFTVLLCAPWPCAAARPSRRSPRSWSSRGAELLLVDSFLAANAAALSRSTPSSSTRRARWPRRGLRRARRHRPVRAALRRLLLRRETLAWVVLTVHLLLAALLGDRAARGARAARRRRGVRRARADRARAARRRRALALRRDRAGRRRALRRRRPAAASRAAHDRAQRARGAGGDAPRARRPCEDAAPLQPQPGVGERGRSSSARARRAWPSASTSGATRARSRRRPA